MEMNGCPAEAKIKAKNGTLSEEVKSQVIKGQVECLIWSRTQVSLIDFTFSGSCGAMLSNRPAQPK